MAQSNRQTRSYSVSQGDSPVPSSFLDNDIVKDGWLYVLGKSKKWVRRYFILKDKSSMLAYYKSPKDRTKGKLVQLFLSSCSQSIVKGQKYTFQLISRAESLTLRAESIEDMNSWILVIQNTCAGLLSAGIDKNIEDFESEGDGNHSSNSNNSNTNSPSVELKNEHGKGDKDIKIDIKDSKIDPSIESPKPRHTATFSSSGEDEIKFRKSVIHHASAGMSRRDTMKKINISQPPKIDFNIIDLLKRSNCCCDCNKELNEMSAFISLLIGSFLCQDCAIIHRSLLGPADLRSLPDNKIHVNDFPPFDVSDTVASTFLNFMGNKKVNDYWEANIDTPSYQKPLPTSSYEDKKKFISEKYFSKTFRGDKSGFLFIKTAERKKFKRYWAVLGSSSLDLYRSKEDAAVEASIPMQSCGVTFFDYLTDPDCFSIITPGKRYKIKGVTYAAALEWANCVRATSATLVHGYAAANPSAIKTLAKSTNRRVSRMITKDVFASGPDPSASSNQNKLDWEKLKSQIISFEEQLQSRENEIIELESQLSRSKEGLKELTDQRTQKIKQYLNDSISNHATIIPIDKKEKKEKKDKKHKKKSSHPHNNYYNNPKYNIDSEAIVKRTNREVLVGANIVGLVRELLLPAVVSNYEVEFFLTYRTFISPAFMLSLFSDYWFSPTAPPTIKYRIIEVIGIWISSFYNDIEGDPEGMRHIITFIMELIYQQGFHDEAMGLIHHLEYNMLREKDDEVLNTYRKSPAVHFDFFGKTSGASDHDVAALELDSDDENNTPLDDENNNNNNNDDSQKSTRIPYMYIELGPSLLSVDFMDIDDLEIARQFTLIDQRNYFNISHRQFLNLEWEKSEFLHTPISRFLRTSEHRSLWVLTSIVMCDKNKRSAILGKFLSIAKHAAALRNYELTIGILLAVEDEILNRFVNLWDGINSKALGAVMELRDLLVKKQFYQNMKEKLCAKTSPAIPYLSAFLNELKDIEELTSDEYVEELKNSGRNVKSITKSQLIINLKKIEANNAEISDIYQKVYNFQKRRDCAKIILQLQRYQVMPYNLAEVPMLQHYLLTLPRLSKSEIMNFVLLSQMRELQSEEALGLCPLPPSMIPPGAPRAPPSR